MVGWNGLGIEYTASQRCKVLQLDDAHLAIHFHIVLFENPGRKAIDLLWSAPIDIEAIHEGNVREGIAEQVLLDRARATARLAIHLPATTRNALSERHRNTVLLELLLSRDSGGMSVEVDDDQQRHHEQHCQSDTQRHDGVEQRWLVGRRCRAGSRCRLLQLMVLLLSKPERQTEDGDGDDMHDGAEGTDRSQQELGEHQVEHKHRSHERPEEQCADIHVHR
jgi:hypothetical protein